jgi:hypothetical protein
MLQTRPQVFQAFLRAEVIIRYNYMLLYVMRIMNRYIIDLISIKYYFILIFNLILLLMIKYIMCYLYELCFDTENLIIWIKKFTIFRYKDNNNKKYSNINLLKKSNIVSTNRCEYNLIKHAGFLIIYLRVLFYLKNCLTLRSY